MRTDKTTVERTTVTTQVKINFHPNEVEHIIRCWIDMSMSDQLRPKPQNMHDIAVSFVVDDECHLLAVEAVYRPATTEMKDQR